MHPYCITAPVISRFWSKVDKSPLPTACWTWRSTIRKGKSGGYGVIRLQTRNGRAVTVRAHRLSWVIVYGDFPTHLCVLHRCDNRTCVRPDHLFLGTRADNQHDMKAKGRSITCGPARKPKVYKGFCRGQARPQSKLTEAAVLDIRARFALGVSQRVLATEYRVHPSLISRVARGVAWQHVRSENGGNSGEVRE